jgi:hypothetical protein
MLLPIMGGMGMTPILPIMGVGSLLNRKRRNG